MPAKSEAQRRFLNARFGHAYVKRHHFDNKGKLPERANSDKPEARYAKERMKKKRKGSHGR